MHKKGITEEVAKKRSRRTVKHQRGIVGADLAAIAARRNQTAAVRAQQRTAAIQKAKAEKKAKEEKKEKVKVRKHLFPSRLVLPTRGTLARSQAHIHRPSRIEAADEGRQGWPLKLYLVPFPAFMIHAFDPPPFTKCMSLACLYCLGALSRMPDIAVSCLCKEFSGPL